MSIPLSDEYTKEMAIDDAFKKKLEGGFVDWYPDYWYTFIAIGLPSGQGSCSPLLNSGCPSKTMAMGLGPSHAFKEGSRDVRKMEHRKIMQMQAVASSNRETPEQFSKRARRNNNADATSVSSMASSSTSMERREKAMFQDRKIKHLELELSLLQRLNCPKNEQDACAMKLLNYVRKIHEPEIDTTIDDTAQVVDMSFEDDSDSFI